MALSKNAIYLVTDARILKLALAQAQHLAKQWDCDVHLFVQDDSIISLPRLDDPRVKLRLNEIEQVFPDNLPQFAQWPLTVFQLMVAPDYLDAYDRVLHLDVDVLSLKADPSLWELELETGL